jgi:phosphatidylserine/phosphatidylglycerophosphate/cardiolipin synthase-like enzyme
MYSKGNREWHIIIEDEKLSELFEQYIKYDRDGSEKEAKAGDLGAVLIQAPPVNFPDLFVPVEQFAMAEAVALPQPVAHTVLPKTAHDIVVQPVLTPDNYIGRIMELFNGAKSSIYMQYAYITYSEAAKDKPFTEMLKKLAELSNRPSMDMKIILGGGSSVNDDIRKLVEAGFKQTVFRVQSNIHNKGIVVDGKIVLVSSANWSGDGVVRNRDAGLIIHDSEIAQYYQKVFLDDWDNRAKVRLQDGPAVMVAAEGVETPAGMVRMSWREYYG